ncbi:MAG: hypothetical protein L0Y36_04925 [Planctomycetales bacterium]|nr:hypothetical protein [Planctomycetales bacterium]
MEKQNTSDLPQVVREYIQSVIKAMKYRNKVRVEVSQELLDHFTDALADCRTDEEKQKLAEELIAEFGDVKLLGKLLRRAKKRCRPLWRTMVARAFQLVGVLFLLLVLYVGWFFSGKPIITTNYLEMMNQQVRPSADESMNAWPDYERAVQSYVEPMTLNLQTGVFAEEPDTPPHPQDDQDNLIKLDISPRPLKSLSGPERQIVEKWLSDNRPALSWVHQGNQKPYYWRTYSTGEKDTTELIAVLLPHLSEFKKLAQLCCWQGLREAEHGNVDQAFDAVLESYVLGKHLRNKNILIEQLVAIAIEGLSTKTMKMLLDEHVQTMDAAALDSIRGRFEKIISAEDFTVGFDGEKLFMYDEIQRSFTQSRLGRSHLYVQRVSRLGAVVSNTGEETPLAQWFRILFTHPDREQTLQSAEQFYAAMNELAVQSPARVRNGNIDIDRQLQELTKGNVLLELLMPALEKVNILSHRNRIDSQALPAILAILQYQKQNGTFPETLDALVENGLLNNVPIDPFSDNPLVYKKMDNGFTLYSVGQNFVDDGGLQGKDSRGKSTLWGNDGDAVFWPVNE